MTDNDTTTAWLGRQPIVRADLELAGWELLFRDGRPGPLRIDDPTRATHQMLDAALGDFGFDAVVGPHPAWINCPREVLLDPPPLRPGSVVFEILEDVEPTDEVLAAADALRAAGHTVALDDCRWDDHAARFLGHVDIVKVDVFGLDAATVRAQAAGFAPHGVRMLAEKVETRSEFVVAKAAGFELFQGYFFARPEVLSGRRVGRIGAAVFEVLGLLAQSGSSVQAIESALQRDPVLLARLFRLLSSAALGLRGEVTSVRHAVVMLGRDDLRRWLTVLVATADPNRPEHLVKAALARARVAEQLAIVRGLPEPGEAFLAALASSLPLLTGDPLEVSLAPLPLSARAKRAAQLIDTELGRVVRDAARLVDGLGTSSQDEARLLAGCLAWTERTVAQSSQRG